MVLKCYACSKKGAFRDENEDNLSLNGRCLELKHSDIYFNETIRPENGFLAGVFDGLGGEDKGEEASYKAASVFSNYDGKEDIKECFKKADREITALRGKAGSTAAVLYFKEGCFTAANIGDSRIYIIRNREISRLSVDHTMLEALISSGVIRKDEVPENKYKNYLTKCLGMKEGKDKSAHINDLREVKTGDIFILCSDGLSGVMSDCEISACLDECGKGINPALWLADKAYEKGSKDNVTVIVIFCKNGGLINRFISKLKND